MKPLKKTEYEISPFTLAIVPEFLENGMTGSIALEEKNEYSIRQSPRKLIDEACKYFGSSLRGFGVMEILKTNEILRF
ncbi:competence protein ComK [Salinibacillus kushneri]|uniref:Competence protein ComK n=1 Tax=Salinibacillus kushneri TaxID=237682 RepID=A0A1I0B0S7_9BACI|nr:competence protein ComK [Salinibacillus kushneri]